MLRHVRYCQIQIRILSQILELELVDTLKGLLFCYDMHMVCFTRADRFVSLKVLSNIALAPHYNREK